MQKINAYNKKRGSNAVQTILILVFKIHYCLSLSTTKKNFNQEKQFFFKGKTKKIIRRTEKIIK